MGLKFWEPKKAIIAPFPDKLLRRVSKISTADLIIWAEQALSETSRMVSKYQGSADPVYVDEMLMGAEALHCLLHELKRRTVV